jgi:hypothetical protein
MGLRRILGVLGMNCPTCGRFYDGLRCFHCDPPKYRCHKCSKRKNCKIRLPDKVEDNYEKRLRCVEFVEDPRWWL